MSVVVIYQYTNQQSMDWVKNTQKNQIRDLMDKSCNFVVGSLK